MFEIKRLTTILALVAVSAFGIAACGGGGDDEPAAPAPVEEPAETAGITKDQLIEQGDGICAEVNAAVGTISASTSTSDEDVKASQIADIYSGMAERLADLGTPSDGDAPTEVIDAAQALADSTSADGASALSDFQAAATDYGFTECGDAPVAPSSSGGSSESPGDSGTGGYSAPAPAPSTPAPTTPAPSTPAPDPGGGGGVAPSTPTPTPPSGGGGGSAGSGGISPG